MAPLTPEQQARERIDALLEAAGWAIQDMSHFNRNAAEGVAVREFGTKAGPCDYLLFVGGKACGVIEAKKAGITLSGVAEQAARYMGQLPEYVACWATGLRFDYESTGEETFFRDTADPAPRSRRVFGFHQPHTLHAWLKEDDTLRQRLRHMPPLDKSGLRDCQIDAVEGLERSLADDKPRALIQMATGAGKTFTACTFSWRLLKHAKAKRILFLVDRNNLGDQTLKEYQNYPGACPACTSSARSSTSPAGSAATTSSGPGRRDMRRGMPSDRCWARLSMLCYSRHFARPGDGRARRATTSACASATARTRGEASSSAR